MDTVNDRERHVDGHSKRKRYIILPILFYIRQHILLKLEHVLARTVDIIIQIMFALLVLQQVLVIWEVAVVGVAVDAILVEVEAAVDSVLLVIHNWII